MSKIKGCINPECSEKQKKLHIKKGDTHCKMCGQELSFVCKKCHMIIQEGDGDYCIRCSELRKDNRDKALKTAGVAGATTVGCLGVLGGLAAIVKKIIDSKNNKL